MSQSAPASPEYPDRIDGAVLKVAGVVIIGVIMSIPDITVVNVALPTCQSAFGSGNHELGYSHVAWTLASITQQVATSCGVALMSVVLSSHLKDSPVIPGTERLPAADGGIRETAAAILSNTQPDQVAPLRLDPAAIVSGLTDAASSFAQTYWVAGGLVVATLAVALFLPRRHEESYALDVSPVPEESVG